MYIITEVNYAYYEKEIIRNTITIYVINKICHIEVCFYPLLIVQTFL